MAATVCAALALAVLPWDTSLATQLTAGADALGDQARAAIAIIKPFGRGEVLVILGLAVAALGGGAARRSSLAILTAGLLLVPVVTALKWTIDRVRPSGGEHSFPSGDAATACALVVPLLAAFGWRAAWIVPLAALVGLGRIVEGWHHPADVLAGFALGLTAGFIALRLIPHHWPGLRWWQGAGLAGAVLIVSAAVASWDPSPIPGACLASFATTTLPLLTVLIAARWWRARVRRGPLRIRPGVAVAAVAAIAVAGWLALAAVTTLWDRDEPRNATAVREMLLSGDFLVPTFNGAWRLHKPILPYWLMSGPAAVLPWPDWACRLPAVLASGVILLATAWIARRLIGLWPAVAATAILATTPLLLVAGTAATTDAVMLAGVVVALAAFAGRLAPTGSAGFSLQAPGDPAVLPSWPTTLLIGLATGWAMLAKGPIGLAVPAFLLIGVAVLYRPALRLQWLFHGAVALVIALAAFLAWAVPANAATGGALLQKALGQEVVGRMFEPMEQHGGTSIFFVFYYVPVILAAFLPWTMLLPMALAKLVRGELDRRLSAMLWAWIIPTLVIFSVIATKLPHYILPIMPALALLVAASLAVPITAADRRWLAIGWWSLAPLLLVAGIGLILAAPLPWFAWIPDQRPTPGLVVPAVGLGVLLIAMPLLVRRELCGGLGRDRHGVPLVIGVLAMWVAALSAVFCLAAAPVVERLKPAAAVAAAIRAGTPPNVPVMTMDEGRGFDEPSLYFYLARPPVRGLRGADQAVAWSLQTGPAVLVTTRPLLAEAEALGKSPNLGCAILFQTSGFNYSRGKWVDVVVLRRGP
ncbi:hypothetical protein LBMAG53_30760 [Planctomycetota bacterium]|nr:hypothetical protein LBMAG53_30760 [Planctomycetota bacterium]